MALPRIKESGGVVADPETGTTPSGKQFIKIRFGFKSSRWNQDTNQWEETGKFYIQGTAWGDDAKRINDLALKQGDQVLVDGDLVTEQWEKDGQKQSKTAMKLKKVRRFEKSQNAQQSSGLNNQQSAPQQSQSQQGGGYQGPGSGGWNAPSNDPWSAGGNGGNDQPPY